MPYSFRPASFCLPRVLAVLLASSVSLPVLATHAMAQQMNIVRVDVPASSLTTALHRLAAQAGMQMIFDASVAADLKSAGVSGRMTGRQALNQLLTGTGIQYRFIGETTVKLERPGQAATADGDGSTVLSPIKVESGGVYGPGAPNIAELKAEAIERAQSSSVRELLQKIPGVSGGGGVRLEGQTLAIRGFARQSDVRILLDGAPKNFEKYDQGTVFIDPELLKRVEVQLGATSVRYGNGGFGGTISMESKNAGDMLRQGESWGAWGKTAFHSANREFLETGALYGQSDFGGPVTYDGLVSATWRKNDDMRIGGGEVYMYSDSELTTLTANAGAQYDGHELRASVIYGTSENWGPVAAIRGQLSISQFDIDRYGYAETVRRRLAWRELEDFSSTLKYSYTGDSDLLNFKMMGSLSSTSQYAIRPDIPNYNPGASTGGYENEASYTDIKFEAENTSNFTLGGLSHSANYGIQYQHHDRDIWMYDRVNRTDAQLNYGYYAPWFMPEGTQETLSAFFRDEIKLTETFKITPGLRFDHIRTEGVPNAAPRFNNPAAGHDYSAVSHSGLTPALSLSWEATPSVRFFADWAYAMRAPNIDEIYSTQSGGTKQSQTSRNLEVERNSNLNIGVDMSFDDIFMSGDELATRFSAYHNHVSNPVTRRFGSKNLVGLANGSVPFYWNTPSYDIFGLEAQAHYETDHYFADIGASWMNGSRNGAINDVAGPKTYMNDLFPFTVNTALGFKIPDQDLSFGWRAEFVKEQTRTPYHQGTGSLYARREAVGYAVHGLFLDWAPKEGFMKDGEIHLALDNMFDKKYMPYLSDGISAMPGRNFKISISRKF